MKQQNNEHLHLIANYQKEMQALRDSLNLSIQKFESLSQQKQQDLEEFKNLTEFHVANLKSRMVDAAEAVADNRKSIDDLHQLMLNFHDVYSRKIDTDKVKEELNSLVKECTNSHLNAFQDFQRETKNLISSLTDELTMLKAEMDQKYTELMAKIDSNFSLSRIDRDGVLKEIRIYDKTIFIMEKKIENIYTLIERIDRNLVRR